MFGSGINRKQNLSRAGGGLTGVMLVLVAMAVITAAQTPNSWGIYQSPDGQDVGGGDRTHAVYGGGMPVDAMIQYKSGILTAFYSPGGSGVGIYYSPNGKDLGGGGLTTKIGIYDGSIRVLRMMPYKDGVLTAFASGGIYFSPDGKNLGGGGLTTRVYGGSAVVDAMVPYKTGVLTAFSSGGIYYSPDGNNLGGGGLTSRVYGGTIRVTAMIPYKTGVLTAFSPGGIYYSPDGNNLGGGGLTTSVYGGTIRVDKMTAYKTGVMAAFSSGGIYFSPDGNNLGGGGLTVRVYGGTIRVDQMIAYQNGVLTAFATGGIYLSPDGNNLGGGGLTTRVYGGSARADSMMAYTTETVLRTGVRTTQTSVITSFYVITAALSAKAECKARGGVWINYYIGSHCSALLGKVADIDFTFLNPVIYLYRGYFVKVDSGSTKRWLPEYVLQKLKTHFNETTLRQVQYASSDHTTSSNTAMTDCTNIYFPAGSGEVEAINNGTLFDKDISTGTFLNEGRVRWLLHELTHVQQCKAQGGRDDYAVMWFHQLPTSIIEDLTITGSADNRSIHDRMPMEDAANTNADRVFSQL